MDDRIEAVLKLLENPDVRKYLLAACTEKPQPIGITLGRGSNFKPIKLLDFEFKIGKIVIEYDGPRGIVPYMRVEPFISPIIYQRANRSNSTSPKVQRSRSKYASMMKRFENGKRTCLMRKVCAFFAIIAPCSMGLRPCKQLGPLFPSEVARLIKTFHWCQRIASQTPKVLLECRSIPAWAPLGEPLLASATPMLSDTEEMTALYRILGLTSL